MLCGVFHFGISPASLAAGKRLTARGFGCDVIWVVVRSNVVASSEVAWLDMVVYFKLAMIDATFAFGTGTPSLIFAAMWFRNSRD